MQLSGIFCKLFKSISWTDLQSTQAITLHNLVMNKHKKHSLNTIEILLIFAEYSISDDERNE